MSEERRQHRRIVHPFDGSWTGASGSSRCRIADISLGGCFVQTLATPSTGESTTITVTIGNHALTFHGLVVYAERGMGFAVRFRDIPPEELLELARLLQALEADPPSA